MDARRMRNRVEAFTIFEVTVVLAILGVLITIISVSLNRFNEQLRINSELHGELNHWMMVRANCWKDYYDADSLQFSEETVTIYQPERAIRYRVADNHLMRQEESLTGIGNEWVDMEVAIDEIREEINEQGRYIIFSFPWKANVMEIRYYCNGNNQVVVNEYFDQLNE